MRTQLWMRKNIFKLNACKTEVIVFGSKEKFRGMEKIKIKIGDVDKCLESVVRNLEAYLEQTMSIYKPCSEPSNCAYASVQYQQSEKLLVYALDIFRIDYASSLYIRLTPL